LDSYQADNFRRERDDADAQPVKVLALRRPDSCADCSTVLEIGTKAAWDPSSRSVRCLPCSGPSSAAPAVPASAAPVLAPEPSPIPVPVQRVLERPVPAATAGGSAQREYERRSQRREATIRSRHPRLGGLLLALSNEPSSTRVWAQAAGGERAVAAKLY
jgi:hypothetical protein